MKKTTAKHAVKKKPATSRRSKAPATPTASPEGFFAAVREIFTSSGADRAPKATAHLETHHRELEALFAQIEEAKGEKKRSILQELATRLLAHMVIEEKIFYPRALGVDRSHVLEGYEEHVVIRFALERALVTAPGDETFRAKVKTLKDFLVNHDDEEEKELFPKVRRAMSLDAQRKLGAEMLALFDETVASGWKKTLAAEGPQTSSRVRRVSARATA